jgi:hypothetical protein
MSEDLSGEQAPVKYSSLLLRRLDECGRLRWQDPRKFIVTVEALIMELYKKLREPAEKFKREEVPKLLEEYRKQYQSEEIARAYAYQRLVSYIVDLLQEEGLLVQRQYRILAEHE